MAAERYNPKIHNIKKEYFRDKTINMLANKYSKRMLLNYHHKKDFFLFRYAYRAEQTDKDENHSCTDEQISTQIYICRSQ
jgi:hypothetical protein